MKRLAVIPLSVILSLMIGCASIGLPVPETFNQKLIVGYSTVTAIRTTNAMLLDASAITADDGENVSKAADVARTGLDVARALSRTDMTAAEGKLTAVRTTIAALSAYLSTRSK